MRTRASSGASASCAVEGHRLAARVSGDSAVAFSWAYCQALEGLPAARSRRAPHGCARSCSKSSASPIISATSGALGNDAGFAFGLAQFSRLKEPGCAPSRRPSDNAT